MSLWARWRLKSPASRSYTQSFVRTQIKENIKGPRHWPFTGNSPVTGEFPAQMFSNAENVSIWWRHHGYKKNPSWRMYQALLKFGCHILHETIVSLYHCRKYVICVILEERKLSVTCKPHECLVIFEQRQINYVCNTLLTLTTTKIRNVCCVSLFVIRTIPRAWDVLKLFQSCVSLGPPDP